MCIKAFILYRCGACFESLLFNKCLPTPCPIFFFWSGNDLFDKLNHLENPTLCIWVMSYVINRVLI